MRMAVYIYPFNAIVLTLMVKSIYEHSSVNVTFPIAIMILAFMAYRFSRGYINTNFAIIDFMSILYTPLISYIIGFI